MQIRAEANVKSAFEGFFRLFAIFLTKIKVVVHRLLEGTPQGVNIPALYIDVDNSDDLYYQIIIMERLFTPAFRKFVKKQLPPLQLAIQDEVDRINADPDMGKGKKGDLANMRVNKFKFQRQEYLIAYEAGEGKLIFFMIGTHENFYRDLKRYEKEY